MANLSRRQFSTFTLLGGLCALAAPRSSTAQTEDTPIAQPITIAQPSVSIAVNDVALTFLVDTASPYSSINPDVASWLGLTPTGEQTVPGAGTTVQAQLYSGALASDEGALPFQFAAVESLSLVSEHASAPELEGILGADFLGQFTDISLTDTSFTGVVCSTSGTGLDASGLNAELPPPFTITYPVIKIGRDYYVIIEIVDGRGRRVRRVFLLDTGAQVSVLTTQQALYLGLLPLWIAPNPLQVLPAMVPIDGVGGGAVGLVTPVRLPGLGTFTFVITNLPVRRGVVGIIGADVLGASFTLQLNRGIGTLTITTPLGQVIEFFISLFRGILRATGISARNLKQWH